MTAAIGRALGAGFSANNILNHIMRQYPNYAGQIRNALAYGYAAEHILGFLKNGRKGVKELEKIFNANGQQSAQGQSTEFEDKLASEKRNEQQLNRGVGTAALAVAGLGLGAGLARGLGSQAIRPSAILPAQRGLPARGAQAALPGAAPKQLGYNPRPPQAPGPAAPTIMPTQPNLPGAPGVPGVPMQQGSQPPASPTSTSQMPVSQPLPGQMPTQQTQQRKPIDSEHLVSQIGWDKRIQNLAKDGIDDKLIASVMQAILSPNQKEWLEKKTDASIPEIVQDFLSKSIKTKEKEPLLEENPQKVQPNSQEAPMQAQERPSMEPISPQLDVSQEKVKGTQKMPSVRPSALPENVSKKLQENVFSIPTYKGKNESAEEYKQRRTIDTAINKAANAIKEGKSFMDFLPYKGKPGAKRRLSTASDVLRFMGGIPNVFDPLLTEEEKQELNDGFESEAMKATPGERAIHGALTEPNMVWNLLLTLEPNLSNMDVKSVKGYKAVRGDKMGTTELRRALNHAVYGVLSGKSISPELSDKIDKISNATSMMDSFLDAFKQGNMRESEKLMEQLSEDEELFNMLMEEVDEELIKKYR